MVRYKTVVAVAVLVLVPFWGLYPNHLKNMEPGYPFHAKSLIPLDEPEVNLNLNQTTRLPLCPYLSPLLRGFTRIRHLAPSLKELGLLNKEIPYGGHYTPVNCQARSRVAIIVPYRDRLEHLRVFLHHLIPILKRQQLEFNIFVIEQGGPSKNEPFNRAMLFNVGFVEANKRYPHWQCYIFHDVDLLPENDFNLYDCPAQPRHMTVALDRHNYMLPYKTIFGGVAALSKQHFLKVNGFSNMFWGWGGEDDDMAERILFNGLEITRHSPKVARYRSLKHVSQTYNEERFELLTNTVIRLDKDGLSNLNYTVEGVVLEKTHTLIRVRLFVVGDPVVQKWTYLQKQNYYSNMIQILM